MTKRIAWVDFLESIAIFAVVFYHCTAHIANYPVSNLSSGFYLHYFFRSLTAACVPLFFFVNGYLLLSRPFDLRRHLLKTLKFIGLALFWYIFTLGFLVFLHRDDIAVSGLMGTISSLKSSINHLWYLGALVCLYIFFPLIKVAYDHHRSVFIYFTLICSLIVFGNSLLNHLATFGSNFIIHREALYSETNFLSIFNPFRGIYGFSFAYFCLGGVAAIYLPKLKQISLRKRNILATVGLFLGWLGVFGLGMMYSRVTGFIWDQTWHGYDAPATLLMVFSIFTLCLNWHYRSRLLEIISRHTLGIYLIHLILIYLAVALFGEYIMKFMNPLSTTVPFVVSFIGTLVYSAIILFISLVLSLILRKTPIIRHLVM